MVYEYLWTIPPTSQLPSIKSISQNSLETLENAVEYLRRIYNPPVRGSRRRRTNKSKEKIPGDGLVESLRNDAFERKYAMRWLTAVISKLEFDSEEADTQPEGPSGLADTQHKREALIEKAASLLATCAGTASAGRVTRDFSFNLVDCAAAIAIRLTDVPLDNQDYGSVGAQTWGGACVMAEMITESPETFSLPMRPLPGSTLRCLELGAGTGLVGITVAKTMEWLIQQRQMDVNVDVVATDYYPSVLANLAQNVRANCSTSDTHTIPSQVDISTNFLDWSTFCDLEDIPETFQSGFDVVYGADIIYELQHAIWIKRCLAKLLLKPSQSQYPDPTFHLIIPLRATHAIESSTIENVFPTESGHGNVPVEPQLDGDLELVIKHKEIIICDAESGRDGEEVEYAYYRIGWSPHTTDSITICKR
ncbi:hypothetical protein CVT26_003255 [Gymnopilus dilepis]|uniref:Uncharacterized protein n=1 Tax=Gymnopilus dilepis TaxID=231916 RepID=A0A409Y507_9AGAR|nr:hypothetical protein CVT26_003255 [Gymnopilus dilepis]